MTDVATLERKREASRRFRERHPAKARKQTREAVRRRRERHPEKARRETREAVRRHRERPAVIPADAQFFSRPACPDCGRVDPNVYRTLERSEEVLVQRLVCPGCGEKFTAVFE